MDTPIRSDTERQKMAELIRESMEPLLREAKQRKLWFHCNYQDMWFHPDDLRRDQADGHFVWGPSNWELRDPQEKIKDLWTAVLNLQQQIHIIEERIERD